MAYGLMKRATELVEEQNPQEPAPLPEHLELHENVPELDLQEYSYYDQLSIELEDYEDYEDDDWREDADSDDMYQDYSLIADKYDKW